MAEVAVDGRGGYGLRRRRLRRGRRGVAADPGD